MIISRKYVLIGVGIAQSLSKQKDLKNQTGKDSTSMIPKTPNSSKRPQKEFGNLIGTAVCLEDVKKVISGKGKKILDGVELRLDSPLFGITQARQAIQILGENEIPIIISCRAKVHGGLSTMGLGARVSKALECLSGNEKIVWAVDIEGGVYGRSRVTPLKKFIYDNKISLIMSFHYDRPLESEIKRILNHTNDAIRESASICKITMEIPDGFDGQNLVKGLKPICTKETLENSPFKIAIICTTPPQAVNTAVRFKKAMAKEISHLVYGRIGKGFLVKLPSIYDIHREMKRK